MKTCTLCKEKKELKDFHPRSDYPGKHLSRCKNCINKTQLMLKFDLTLDELNAILKSECCEICGYRFKSRRELKIDHCHHTGAVRGTLCNSCNVANGWIEKVDLEKHLNYIEKWRTLK